MAAPRVTLVVPWDSDREWLDLDGRAQVRRFAAAAVPARGAAPELFVDVHFTIERSAQPGTLAERRLASIVQLLRGEDIWSSQIRARGWERGDTASVELNLTPIREGENVP